MCLRTPTDLQWSKIALKPHTWASSDPKQNGNFYIYILLQSTLRSTIWCKEVQNSHEMEEDFFFYATVSNPENDHISWRKGGL